MFRPSRATSGSDAVAAHSLNATLATLLLTTACATRSVQSFDRVVEEDRIYAAILDSLFTSPANTRLVVSETVKAASNARLLMEGIPAEFAGAIQDFRTENLPARKLTILSGTRIPVQLAADSVMDRIRSEAAAEPRDFDRFWKTFYATFPGSSGIVSFSRVGFDGDRAFVDVFHGCGMLCASGGYVTLQRRNGRWHVVRHHIYVVS
jgi:hypothetical protein